MTQSHVLKHLLVDLICKARLIEKPKALDDLIDQTVSKLRRAIHVQDDLLSETEVCDRYRFLTPAKLRIMRCRGKGPVYLKFGKARNSRVFYKSADVEAWIAEHYQLEPFLAPPPNVKRGPK